MAASGPAFSQLFLLLMAIGGASNDLVSLFDARDYFEAHGIATDLKSMLELAQRTGEGKEQIAQLLAIRRLGEDFSEAKAKVTETLKPVARGEKAQDPQGFAREYATRALRRLGVEAGPLSRKKEYHLTRDVLGWFPNDVRMVGAVYVASITDQDPKTEEQFRRLVKKAIPARTITQLYDLADKVGNVRADAVGFGVSESGKENSDKTRFYLRVKGKADARRFAAYLADTLPNGRADVEKDGSVGTVRIVTAPDTPPAFAFLGDTDLLMAGYGDHRQNHLDVLRQVLKVRAEGKDSVLAGALDDELKKVAPNAIGLVVGELSPQARNEFQRGLGVKLPSPERVHLEVARSAKGIDLRLAATYENEEHAREFAAGLARVNKQAIEALEKLPDEKLPAKIKQLLRTTLGTFQADAAGKTVNLHSQVPVDLIKALPDLLIRTITLEATPPPRLEKTEKKGGG
jgi:hypothetical protein